MTLAARREIIELAERAHALVQADPFTARNLAEDALRVARDERDVEAEVVALHALGFAYYALGDRRALRTMRSAIRLGERYDLTVRAALVRRNLAMCLAYAGKARASIREIDAARSALRGPERARTEVFRIPVYWLAGRGVEAVEGSGDALRSLRRRRDSVWEARLLYNRAAVLTLLGRHRGAGADLERARDLYTDLGLTAAAADVRIELARVRSRDGDYIGCLAALDEIDISALSEWAACWLHLCRADALVELRLLPEAREDLASFEEQSRRAAAADSLTQARLEGALLALVAGEAEAAEEMAASARRSFAARGQATFSAQASLVVLAAVTRTHAVSPSALRAGLKATRQLAADGRPLDALRGHLVVARAAAVGGHRTTVDRELAAARTLERKGTTVDRIELRYVEALQQLGRGDRRRAARSLQRGLEILESYRMTLGATELRATASALGVDLSRLGVSIALSSGDPTDILAWAERLRGNALRLPVVRTEDHRLRRQRAELRSVERALRTTGGDGSAARSLGSRRAALEQSVKSHARLQTGRATERHLVREGPSATRRLAGRALVEYVELDGRLRAVTLVGDTLALHELGEIDVSDHLEWLRFALKRLARGGLVRDARASMLANASAAAQALERQLIAPLLDTIDDAPLVIVPTGPLHAVPWGALPSLRGRPVTVAPSLSTWLDLSTRGRRRHTRATLVAGPGLRHVRAEVNEVAALLPGATVLTGPDATVEATLAALDGATLAHVACHGRFRSDSPLFSSLELADGPLTALDIQGLRRPPDVLVLSACDVALSERHPGDELLGLSAALLASGTRTIIASVVPVPDAAARRLMLAFHRRLAAGASPASALAEAQAGLRGDQRALAGFLCLGAG